MGNLLDFDSVLRLKQEKETEYYNYLCKHRAQVRLVWMDIRQYIRHALPEYVRLEDEISKRIDAHDLDKFSSELFPYYRQRNFPFEGEVLDKQSYARARRLHILNSKHHPEHWLSLEGELVPVADWDDRVCALFETLCDWEAASQYNQRTGLFWYKLNENTIKIEPSLIPLAEQVLSFLEELAWSRGLGDSLTFHRTFE